VGNQKKLGESSDAVAKQQYTSDLKASSLLLGELEHPNKMPFSGVLTWFDAPSDSAPHGSGGLPVVIPSAVGVPALSSLIGMAVNFQPGGWDGHSPTDKIGVITAASAGEPEADGAVPVHVEGYIYAHDFESAATDIKLNQSALGFSIETAKTRLQAGTFNGEEVAVVSDIGYFTGAAILLKSTAAWRETALAAAEDDSLGKEDENSVEEQLKALMASVEALRTFVESKFAVQEETTEVVASEEAEVTEEAAAEEAAPAEETSEAVQEEASVEATEEASIEAAEEVDAVDVEALQADLQAAQDRIATLEADLEASKREATSLQAASRKSVPYAGALMAKFGLNEADEETNLMAEIDKRTDLSIEERIAAKLELRQKRMRQQ
jgi:hypothetical protein